MTLLSKGRCEICQTYTVEYEVGIIPEKVETKLPPKLEEMFGDVDRTDYFTYDMCFKCLSLVKDEYPDRLKFARSKEPGYDFVYSGVSFWTMFRILFERAIHGVSWWEANGLDEWLIPETVLTTGDAELHRLWAKYNLEGALLLPPETVDPLWRGVSSRLCLVWRQYQDEVKSLVPKLRYIFRKYSDAYAYGHPPSLSEEEWKGFVEEVRRMFEDDPFKNEWSETFKLFCERLEAFWW